MSRLARRGVGVLLALLLSLAPLPGRADGPPVDEEPSIDEAVSPKREKSIGVARFERAAAAGAEVPDVASLLAQRLTSLGAEGVLGPEELGLPAEADPSVEQVRSWTGPAGLQSLVVGRTTRLGDRVSVDVRVHDGATGGQLGPPFFAEMNSPGELAATVDRLAQQVLVQVGSPPPAAPAQVEEAAAEAAPEPAAGFRRDAPISIRSDELEAFDQGEQKRFVFTGNVRASQEDLRLRSRTLTAFYPRGSSQPEKLVATGNVVITRTDRKALCDTATYYRDQNRVVCVGEPAELERDCDRVRGDEITFHLDTEVLKVSGAADVEIESEDATCVQSARAEP